MTQSAEITRSYLVCIHSDDEVCLQERCPMWSLCKVKTRSCWRPSTWPTCEESWRRMGRPDMPSWQEYELGAETMLQAIVDVIKTGKTIEELSLLLEGVKS